MLKAVFKRLFFIALVGLVPTAAEATCPQFHILTNNSPADANQVMENYNYILQCPDFIGSVGVGTASPVFKLEVIAPNDGIRVLSGSSTSFARVAIGRTSHEFSLGVAAAPSQFFTTGVAAGDAAVVSVGNLQLGSNAVSSPTMTMTTGGNVGIGTGSPDLLLSVNGGADKASGGSSWAVFSDRRLKVVEGRYRRGLADLIRLDPVRFHYKANNPLGLPSTSDEVGVVAQDAQKVFPESVSESRLHFLEFNMSPVQFAMINAIKELKATSDRQNVQIAKLGAAHIEDLSEIALLKQRLAVNDQLSHQTAQLARRLERLERALQARTAEAGEFRVVATHAN